jgi:hypothetical protein
MRFRIVVVVLALPLLAAAARADEARGRVVAVDLDHKEMTLAGVGRARGTEYHFTLDDRTKVYFAGQPGTLADLPGVRRARVEYERRGNRDVARVVRVLGPAPAARGGAAAVGEAPAEKPGGDAVTGVLRRVARTDRELVVIGPGAGGPKTETTVSVPEGTPVTRDGRKVDLGALQEGDPVTVQVERKDGAVVARSVRVGPPAAAARDAAIPRVRAVLKMVDQILEQAEKRSRPPER